MSPHFVPSSRAVAPEHQYILSRFVYLHREGNEMSLESPLSHARILLHDERAAMFVFHLKQPQRASELITQTSLAQAAGELLALLLEAQMAWDLDESGNTLEDEAPALRCWEFHDLLFHARSRGGRHDSLSGGTFRLAGSLPPPPALRPCQLEGSVPLYRPDLDRIEREDPPFGKVQELRRSIREYAAEPISDRQIGEFLYRVGRMADYWESEFQTPERAVKMAFAPRPYPSGGALYELELYLAVQTCRGLSPGLYHYDPEHHHLEPIAGPTEQVQQLLLDAALSTGIAREHLQVLIITTARFQRIAWKYASMAYALILKDVGVLCQTMYLAATAMGVAPCGVGYGDSDLFARAASTDYYTETSVGEFLLGSKKEVVEPVASPT
jgi:SagB-type dehydrogenase family enzyme